MRLRSIKNSFDVKVCRYLQYSASKYTTFVTLTHTDQLPEVRHRYPVVFAKLLQLCDYPSVACADFCKYVIVSIKNLLVRLDSSQVSLPPNFSWDAYLSGQHLKEVKNLFWVLMWTWQEKWTRNTLCPETQSPGDVVSHLRLWAWASSPTIISWAPAYTRA